MNEIKRIIIILLSLFVLFITSIYSLFYTYKEYNIMKELIHSDNKYLAEVIDVSIERGIKTYINFKINKTGVIYKGGKDFYEYKNSIYKGKYITVIFDKDNKEYIIEDFINTYKSSYKSLLYLGVIFLFISVFTITYILIRIYH
jgi:uncharacterized membrane protein YesL